MLSAATPGLSALKRPSFAPNYRPTQTNPPTTVPVAQPIRPFPAHRNNRLCNSKTKPLKSIGTPVRLDKTEISG